MTETFIRENDYSLSVIQETEETLNGRSYYATKQKFSLKRTFNFLSAQVTTLARESIISPSSSSSDATLSSLSMQMIIQNFSDFESKEEIRLMHEKLKELGGKPPELSFVLDKKAHGL